MLPQEQLIQLILGIAASLIFWALMRWTPLLRDALAALAVVGLIYFTRNLLQSGSNTEGALGRLLREVLTYPLFFLGLAVATTFVLAVHHAFRER